MPKYKFVTPKNNNISLLYDFKTKNLTDYVGLFFVIDDLYFRNSTNIQYKQTLSKKSVKTTSISKKYLVNLKRITNNIVGIKHEVCDGQMNRENIFENKN